MMPLLQAIKYKTKKKTGIKRPLHQMFHTLHHAKITVKALRACDHSIYRELGKLKVGYRICLRKEMCNSVLQSQTLKL